MRQGGGRVAIAVARNNDTLQLLALRRAKASTATAAPARRAALHAPPRRTTLHSPSPAMIASHFASIDALMVLVALASVLAVGWRMRGRMQSASDFLFGSEALPSWVAGIGLLAANVGLPEVIGMGAAGAMYGFSAAHFYWMGAVPALVFLGLFMIPVYRSAGARSVPEYLGLRFDQRIRTLSAVAFAVASLMIGGVALHVAGTVLQLLLGWPFAAGVALAAFVATACVLAGGLSASIYAGVLQFALLVFGLAPLLLIGFAATDGWPMLQHRLSQGAINSQLPPAIFTQVWKGMGHPLTNAFGITHLALFAGIGGAVALGTWCGDVRVMQRAMSATRPGAARRAPLIAAIPALFLPAILMIPGMLARMLGGGEAGAPFGGMAQGLIPARRAADGTALLDRAGHSLLDFGIATPKLLATLYPAGMLGLGVAALLAACTAGFAANLTTFNTMLGWDLRRLGSGIEIDDATRLRRARLATLLGAVLAIAVAYAVRAYAASPRGMRATGGGAYVVGGVGSLVDVLTLAAGGGERPGRGGAHSRDVVAANHCARRACRARRGNACSAGPSRLLARAGRDPRSRWRLRRDPLPVLHAARPAALDVDRRAGRRGRRHRGGLPLHRAASSRGARAPRLLAPGAQR